jgi:hypothetical protein
MSIPIVRDHVRATWQVHVNIDGDTYTVETPEQCRSSLDETAARAALETSGAVSFGKLIAYETTEED